MIRSLDPIGSPRSRSLAPDAPSILRTSPGVVDHDHSSGRNSRPVCRTLSLMINGIACSQQPAGALRLFSSRRSSGHGRFKTVRWPPAPRLRPVIGVLSDVTRAVANHGKSVPTICPLSRPPRARLATFVDSLCSLACSISTSPSKTAVPAQMRGDARRPALGSRLSACQGSSHLRNTPHPVRSAQRRKKLYKNSLILEDRGLRGIAAARRVSARHPASANGQAKATSRRRQRDRPSTAAKPMLPRAQLAGSGTAWPLTCIKYGEPLNGPFQVVPPS
jgi:hypothetical protein